MNLKKSQFLLLFCTAVLAVFSAYLYLSHLSGALGFNSDENRVYHFQLMTPLLYLFSKPFIHMFRSMDAPYYLQGVMGLANILMMFWIVKSMLSVRTAIFAVVFFVLYDYPLVYAKLLYYSTMHLFFMLAAIASFFSAEKRGGWVGYVAAGIFLGFMFPTNASGLIPMAFMGLFFLVARHFKVYSSQGISLIRLFLILAVSVIGVYTAFEGFLMFWYRTHPGLDPQPYWKSVIHYGAETPTYYQMGLSYIREMAGTIWNLSFCIAEGGIFRNALILVGIIGGSVFAYIRRDARVLAMVVLLFGGIGIVAALAILKVQPFFARTLLWTTLPITVLIAYFLESLWNIRRYSVRSLMCVVLMVYVFYAGQKCLAITQSVYSVDPINRYLLQQGIVKREVLSIFPINRYEDWRPRTGTLAVPGAGGVHLVDGKNQTFHHLHWPAIRYAYRAGIAKYLLTSGIGGVLFRVGESDPILARIQPRAEWSHPSDNRHYALEKPFAPVRLYSLDDVFSRPDLAQVVENMHLKLTELQTSSS